MRLFVGQKGDDQVDGAIFIVIVVTGDRKIIEPALRAANLAPIVIVDASGKPLSGATP